MSDTQAVERHERHSSVGTVFRRIGSVLISMICAGMLLGATTMSSAYSLIGSPKATADIVVAVATNPSAANSIANTILNDLSDRSGQDLGYVIAQNRTALTNAVTSAITAPATRLIAHRDVELLYHYIRTGQPGWINFTPLVAQVTIAMHRAVPAVPASPNDPAYGNLTLLVHFSAHHPLNIAGGLLALSLLFGLVGIVGALLNARFMVRHRWAKLTSLGLTILLPALVAISVGARSKLIAQQWNYSDQTVQILVQRVVNKAATTVASAGLWLIAIDAALLAGWAIIWLLRDRHAARSTSDVTDATT